MSQGLGHIAAGFLQGFGPVYAQGLKRQEAELEEEQKRTKEQIQNLRSQMSIVGKDDPRYSSLQEEAIRLLGGTPLPPQMAKLSSLPLEKMRDLTEVAAEQVESREEQKTKDKKKASRALKIFDALEKERQAWEDYNAQWGDKSSILQEFGEKPAWNKRKEKLWREAAELHFKIEGIDPRTISGEPPGPSPTIARMSPDFSQPLENQANTLEEFIRKQKEAGKTEEEAFMEAMKAEL